MKTHQTAAFAGLALVLACGAPSSEEQLAEATQLVRDIETRVEEARLTVEREERDLEAAETELAEARHALRNLQEKLTAARLRLAETTDDATLFRAVQTALLSDSSLEGLAIGARVRDRVVTLEGKVPSVELRKRAETVAAETPGVERVENQVTVQPKAAPAPPS